MIFAILFPGGRGGRHTAEPLKKKLLLVFPTAWDERHFRSRESRASRYDVELTTPLDHDCRWDFDVLGFIEEQVSRRKGLIDGVFSSSDYPGATVAAAISERLGLPGSKPERVLESSHKYYSRILQREAVPEATPGFHLIDPKLPRGGAAGLQFPCFIKPVKGAFSVMSRRLNDWEDLEEFLARPSAEEFVASYVHMFNRLIRELTDLELDGSYFLAEDFLKGRQVTVDGFATESTVGILGVVDSIRHPRTKSFVRFDYPSSLSRRVQARMHDIARRVIERLGLKHTQFNIEMTYDLRRDRIFIVEVNPRMCGQFADLYEKVDGTNGYEVACALAAGERPVMRRGGGRYRVASSFPLRVFTPSRVIEAPSAELVSEVEHMFEGTLIWTECFPGDSLSDFESLEDGKSFRYGVVNLGAPNRDALYQRLDEITRALGYRFQPL